MNPLLPRRTSRCRLLPLRRLAAALACGAAVAAQAQQPASFHLSDDAAGPSCEYFTTMGWLKWERKGGDWADVRGARGGEAPFASRLVRPGDGRPFVDWDVTALVQAWLEGRPPNDGFFLRAQDAAGDTTVSFHSRESADVTARPTLKLKWEDGRADRLSPSADTYLDCTSIYSLGQRQEVRVGTRRSSILRFELPKPERRLLSATLQLTSDRQDGPVKVSVFRVSPPFASHAAEDVRRGVAQRYDHDAGIERDPDVLFAEGFENRLWPWRWRDLPIRGSATMVEDDDDAMRFEPLRGGALRVRIRKDSNLGVDLRYYFKRHFIDEPEEVFLRYYIRFAADWNPWLDGGKLPGIAGTYGRAGWGMRPSDGHNGWSARAMFAQRPRDAPAVAGRNVLGTFAYHAAPEGRDGQYWGWNLAPGSLMENNRWYCIEQRIVLNAPGQANGLYEVWIDGVPALHRTGVRFRDTAALKVETIWFNVYHGGLRPAPQDMTLYLDQVVVARRYIGPMGGGAAATGLKHARAN